MRIMRALEVHLATGRSIASFQGERHPGPLDGAAMLKLFVSPEREEVRQRIDRRFEQMIAQGALGEVAALRERRLDPLLPVMRAHGVPGLIAHLDGRLGLDEAIARGQADTRAYAKRQVTWFRHQMAGLAGGGSGGGARGRAACVGGRRLSVQAAAEMPGSEMRMQPRPSFLAR